LLIAHRAGNNLASLKIASASGADLVEGDVHPYRGELQVRHLKTMGPIPLLWDRWELATGWKPGLQLADLLAAMPADCELMLDLKPGDAQFAQSVLAAVQEQMPGREYSVCSQFWNLLEPFRDDSYARVVHSVGNARLLRDVLPRLGVSEFDAVSIHMKLLTPDVVAELSRRVSLVMTWPANRLSDVRRLQSWGVNGFTIDDRELLRFLASERRA
jgi:hypothetical protein